MKQLFLAFLVLAAFTTAFYSCTGSKDVLLDSDPLLKVENPFWQEIYPGQQDGKKSMALIIPYAFPIENYAVDSVYFKGYHEKLVSSQMGNKEVYRVQIFIDENKEAIQPPYEITENEALVSYVDKSSTKRYFKVSNIVKKDPIVMP